MKKALGLFPYTGRAYLRFQIEPAAHGRAGFLAEIQIALKECSESEYWRELLIESGFYDDKIILEQCIEIKKLLIASLNTAKTRN